MDREIEKSKDTFLGGCRNLVNRAFTYFKRISTQGDQPETFCYYDSSGQKVSFTITHEVSPGEVDRPVLTPYDWTRDWDWLLSVQFKEKESKEWWILVHIFLNDLPDLLCKPVSWKNPRRLTAGLPFRHYKYNSGREVEFPWGRLWRFSEPVGNPCWGASIDISHKKYAPLAKIEDPWSLMTNNTLIG